MSEYWVGLTGGVGSGKSEAAKCFEHCGATVADADVLAREVVADAAVLQQLRSELGGWVTDARGAFDRAAVRQKVFACGQTRRALEAILHPPIRARLCAALRAAKTPYAVGVVPLLFEGVGWAALFARVAVVECTADLQRARVRARDGGDDADAIMAAQVSAARRRAGADDLIDNNGSLTQLRAQVEKLHGRYAQSAKILSTDTGKGEQ